MVGMTALRIEIDIPVAADIDIRVLLDDCSEKGEIKGKFTGEIIVIFLKTLGRAFAKIVVTDQGFAVIIFLGAGSADSFAETGKVDIIPKKRMKSLFGESTSVVPLSNAFS